MLPEYARPQVIELSVAMAYIVMRGVAGGRWQASTIHFVREAPHDMSTMRRFFAVPVEFGCAFDGISCPTAAMATPTLLADATMARHARRLLAFVPLEPEHNPLSDRTRRAITLLLPTGRATLELVAHNLGLTARALQRGLEKEQCSFAVLLNAVRKELAQRYLVDFERPVGAIAGLTGYSSLSAFGRWFAAEFGASPNAWRLTQLGIPSAHMLDRAASLQGGRRH